jgi:hypothetical protein
MKRAYTLPEANSALRLLRSIAGEIVERRAARGLLRRERKELEAAGSPEGFSQALAELDARIYEHDEALFACRRELDNLGMTVLRMHPLTIHIPGQSRSGPVVFCWEEGEDTVCFGHPVGEEQQQRRPLRLRAS